MNTIFKDLATMVHEQGTLVSYYNEEVTTSYIATSEFVNIRQI